MIAIRRPDGRVNARAAHTLTPLTPDLPLEYQTARVRCLVDWNRYWIALNRVRIAAHRAQVARQEG